VDHLAVAVDCFTQGLDPVGSRAALGQEFQPADIVDVVFALHRVP
jgi:hypothetical protein